MQAIAASVRKTGRLVVANEGARAGGLASEIVARVVDECFRALQAEPERVTALDTPIPYAAALERFVLPTPEDVYAAAMRTLDGAT